MGVTGLIRSWRCPAEMQWSRLAANMINEREANRLLTHAAACSTCSTRLKDNIFLLQQEEGESPGSPEIGLEYEQRIPALARWMAEQARWRSGFIDGIAGMAALVRSPSMIAATSALAAGLVLFALWPQSPPLSDLAGAYSTRRTVDLRIPP